MIFALISAWLAYKKARVANRNPILWAIVAAATFIVTQVLIQIGGAIFLGLCSNIFGWSEDIIYTYSLPISIFAIIASFGSTWLVLRYLDNLSEETLIAPPPPPTFDGK